MEEDAPEGRRELEIGESIEARKFVGFLSFLCALKQV